MNIKEAFVEAEELLAVNNIENPSLNAGLILEEVTEIKRLSLPLFYDKEITNQQKARIKEMVKRRCKHEPLQYIFGYTEFYGSKILVNPEVLIPRPETEYLLETIRNYNLYPKRIIDIGTGSGAIAISLKKIFPQAQVIGLDISFHALEQAKENAKLNEVEIDFVQADVFSDDLGKFDLLVSNPPYIPQDEYMILPDEVKNFEPKLALVGADAGLYFYKRIIKMSKIILNPQGVIFFEVGEYQGEFIKKLALESGFSSVKIIQDLVGKDRIVFMS